MPKGPSTTQYIGGIVADQLSKMAATIIGSTVDDEQLLDISNLSWSETYHDVRYNPLLKDRQKKRQKVW